jgi:DNA-binding NarL/FixJ family response regulator
MYTLPIVLIDDDRVWLETLADYLEEKGFRVVSTSSPAQALAALRQQEAGLVISDYHMPGMNGLELARCLREQHKRTAVLLLSSAEEPDLAERARAAGVRAFLAKAASPRLLLRRILELVEEPAGARRTPALQMWQRLLPAPRQAGGRRAG